jgi:dihydroflavonol-4-reductase
MEKGELGQQYALGGENVSHREFYQLLSDVTGLAEPGDDLTFGKANLAATWDQMRAWWNHEEPLWTKQAIEHEFGKYAYVSSEKAKKELGYEFRPLREALARSCRWYLENGYLPVGIARRARLELQGA